MTQVDPAAEAREVARQLLVSAEASEGEALDRHFERVERMLPVLAKHLDEAAFVTILAEALAKPLAQSGNLAVLRRHYDLLRDKLLGRGTRTDFQLIGLLENGIGSALLAGGRVENAIEHFEESLACDERAGDSSGRLDSLWNLALACKEAGRLDDALVWIDRALADFPDDGDRRLWAQFQLQRGDAFSARGDFADAREPLEAALHAYDQMKDRGGVGTTAERLAEACGETGDEAACSAYADIAISIPLGMPYELPGRTSNPDTRRASGPTMRPRVFLSYRHEAVTGVTDAARLNTEHRQWVRQLALDLEAHGIDVLWDAKMRAELARRTALSPDVLPFAAELSRIAPAICHAFVPILTPTYLDRILLGPSADDPTVKRGGGAFEEWYGAMPLVNAGLMSGIAIVRSDEAHAYAQSKFRPFIDFRPSNHARYAACVEEMVGLVWARQQSSRPPVALDLSEWIGLYIDWCRAKVAGYAKAPIEAWTWTSTRPAEFLDRALEAARAAARASDSRPTQAGLWSALEVRLGETASLGWADFLAEAIREASEDGTGKDRLAFVVDASRKARAAGDDELSGPGSHKGLHNLAAALAKLGRQERSASRLTEAIALYREVLTDTAASDTPPSERGLTHLALGQSLWELGRLAGDKARLVEARAAFRDALADFAEGRESQRVAATLAEVDAVIAAA